MSRTTTLLGFSVPPAVAREVEAFAREEHRTKSELFREMVRVYRRFREQRDREELQWLAGLLAEAKIEQANNPTTTDQMLAESKRLARAGAKRTKDLGIKTDLRSAVQRIHARRKNRRTS